LNWLIPLKCPKCGETINENDKYCLSCGTDLEGPVEKDIVSAQKYFEKAQWKYDKGVFLSSALTDCEIAIQYNPDSAEIHNLYGLILDALGRTDEAISFYEKAIHLKPNIQDAKDNLRDAEAERNINLLSDSTDADIQNSVHKNNLFSIFGSVYVIVSILVLATIVTWQFYEFIYPYFIPTTEIILVPDGQEEITVEQNDLVLAASILARRAQMQGYSRATFVVSKDGYIVGKIPITADADKLVLEIGKVGLLEFVDFGKTAMLEDEEIKTDFETKYYFSPGEAEFGIR
jgi:tetratricopeptide (TPR) repeat protein